MGSNGKVTHSAATAESSTPPSRRKKMKLLPALFCAGLSYVTFYEKCSHMGIPVNTAEALDGTVASVKGHRDHDLIVFDDLNNEDTYDFDAPNDRNFGSDTKEEKELDNNDVQSDSPPIPPDIIVVVAVDGTLAGISKETGRILWKQSEGDATMSTSTSSSSIMKPPTVSTAKNKNWRGDTSQILKPLVSTTTTTKSPSGATYKAVPSVDGKVYATTNEISLTTSVKDLVSKSPFLDPQGKFYVGSRYASAAALDGETGQILRVVSPSTQTNQDDDDASPQPNLDGRNIIWIGRVDHEISVQDAKTGMVDAQFSVAEIMSAEDMRGMMGKDSWKPEQTLQDGESYTSPNAVIKPSDGAIELSSTLVATPNGNVALWSFEDSRFAWVANEAFASPIAYAMDATTGLIMGLDIIPDVIDPSASTDDLTREIERQSEMASPRENMVISKMSNGQLYALPLRRKRSSATGKITNVATAIASTPSAAAAASSLTVTKSTIHTVSQLSGRLNANSHHNDNNSNQQKNHKQHDPEGTLVVRRSCVPTSPTYPSCLVESYNDQIALPERTADIAIGKPTQVDGGHAIVPRNVQKEDGGFYHRKYGYVPPENLGGFYHPQFGYVSPRDLYGNKRSDQNNFRRILGSWLPPTIALIFVISFELGRRKRLKDEKKDKQNFFLTAEQMDKVNGLVSRDDKFEDRQREADNVKRQEVISVSEDVLGYGGHGTVVYKGVLDGRNVAVKRMLKAYHASADREISLLIESDGDPNVVRYFLKEVRGDFVYLALELCDLSLHELIGVLREKQQEKALPIMSEADEAASGLSSDGMNATRIILFQIASGVKHLHSLRIVHRDLKPAVSCFESQTSLLSSYNILSSCSFTRNLIRFAEYLACYFESRKEKSEKRRSNFHDICQELLRCEDIRHGTWQTTDWAKQYWCQLHWRIFISWKQVWRELHWSRARNCRMASA
jgi:outer membrane protein assembly factor BamB